MKIVRDAPKRQANIEKHRLNSADLNVTFFETGVVGPSHTKRFLAFGRPEGSGVIAVVFRPLGSEAVTVISMRPARRREETDR